MKFQKLIAILFFISIGLVVVVSVPHLKSSVKDFFLNEKRIILAKVQGQVSEDGDRFVILKIRQKDEIFLEIYKEQPKTEQLDFIQKIIIPEKNEGSFTFRGEITNLAFADIDNDSYMEILVPVFNADMTPRLHTFKYNLATDRFEPMP
ncbi:MAG: hypothetical protein KDD45_11295 [Bdellovibrionales bacterium]|nr:hypothetical protein [Bdellovibrionales bacterium]